MTTFFAGNKQSHFLPYLSVCYFTFEFSKIHQPKVEILQFELSLYLLVFHQFDAKKAEDEQKSLSSNCNTVNFGGMNLRKLKNSN